jgi:hypothetical protein
MRLFAGCYRFGPLTIRFIRYQISDGGALLLWWRGRMIVEWVYPWRKWRKHR